MTHEQSLAFVDALVGSPKAKSHLGAVLGHGKIPKADDFNSADADTRDNCEEFISFLHEVVGVLEVIQKNRPRQKRIPLEEDPDDGADVATARRVRRKA